MLWLRRIALFLAVLAAASLLLSGPLTRLGAVPYQAGIALFLLGGLSGVLAALAGFAGYFLRKQAAFLVAAILGVACAVMPAYSVVNARSVPPINDISTDPREMRFPEEQRKAYADVQPLLLPASPRASFGKALTAAEAMKWEIVRSDPAGGRIEAVVTTGWFGFKDDVVVRIAPEGAGSRIDMRSKSRVGKGDAGANARRIRDYFQRLK